MKKLSELDPNKRAKLAVAYQKADGSLDEEEAEYAIEEIQQIDADLVLREQPSDVFNGIPYSEAYTYNRRKGINYAPPRNADDDREVSLGLVHEKIVAFCAIFLKYVWKRRVKCYDKRGVKIQGLGDVLDLAVEHSYRLEKFSKNLLLILWEVFVQGDAWVLEDWQVRLVPQKKAYRKNPKTGERELVTPDNMDYTLEFLESLEYENDEPIQERGAKSVLLDGRQVILGNPEIEEVQDQPRLTIEMEWSRDEAEQLFGSLERWKAVPKDHDNVTLFTGDQTTLFDAKRLKKPEETVIGHLKFDKFRNRYNLFLNGVMMLPRATPMRIFYPRLNYPLTGVHGERLKGSAYSRSIPAKTKFNADFVDWVVKRMSDKFEQGIDPAILSHGKYTLSRKIFRGGQVTHGVKKEDYEKADPDNKGITQSEFSFAEFMKQILEGQTVNPSTSGELSPGATATEISITENNQRDKLGYLLDGLVLGMMDMVSRRIETIESKYTIAERKTLVNGKETAVYQNFTVNAYGAENHILMDASVGEEGFDARGAKDTLYETAFMDKKKGGLNTKYFLTNPEYIKRREYTHDVEMLPERRKDTQLQMIGFFDELEKVQRLFAGSPNMDKWKEEYLEISGRPEDVFNSKDMEQLEKEMAAQNAGPAQPGQPPAAPPKYNTAPKATPQMLRQQK